MKNTYNVMHNVGKAKYLVSYNYGIEKHKDGSDFFAIRIFKNKKDLYKFEIQLKKDGLTYKY